MDRAINYFNTVWNHQGFQKYFRNTGWMFGGRIFILAISFAISIYIARYLGPSNYGLFNYAISFVGLFGFLSSLGLDNILNREIVKDHSRKNTLLGTAFYLKLAGSTLAILAVLTTTLFLETDKLTFILIILFSLNFIPSSFNILETYFNSQVLAKKVVISQITASIISAILKLLLIYFDKGIFWLTVIYIIETLIIVSLLIFNFQKIGNQILKWRFSFQTAKSLLRDSWPLILSGVAVGIYMKIDQVMIKNMLGNEQVGLYAVAVKLSEVWYLIPMIITASVFPAIVKSLKTSEKLFDKRMRKLYSLMFWMAFGIAALMTIFASPIIKLLFGESYLASITVLQIHVWAGIPVFLGAAIGQYLISNNLTKISFYNTILGATLNIILNIVMIPTIGIIGGAIATFVSYTVSTFTILLFSKKLRRHGLLILKSPFNIR